VAARQKLHDVIAEMTNSEGVTVTKSMCYSDLVEKWKRSEGPAMSDNTLKHYSDALRAYILPIWKDYAVDSIQREDITNLLNSQAAKYSRSSLKSMRLVVTMTLAWAERNCYIKRPNGWLDGIRLPRKTGGRKVVRTELETSQTLGIIQQLEEPYSTLVLFLGLCGRRIEEAIGIKPIDLDDKNVLHIIWPNCTTSHLARTTVEDKQSTPSAAGVPRLSSAEPRNPARSTGTLHLVVLRHNKRSASAESEIA
jgi:integrase